MMAVGLILHAGDITQQCQVLHLEVDQAIGWTVFSSQGRALSARGQASSTHFIYTSMIAAHNCTMELLTSPSHVSVGTSPATSVFPFSIARARGMTEAAAMGYYAGDLQPTCASVSE